MRGSLNVKTNKNHKTLTR